MTIASIGSVVTTAAVGSSSTPGPTAAGKFAETLAQAARPGTPGAGAQSAHAAAQPAAAQRVDVVARLAGDQKRMDEVLALAQSGKSFSPAELLSLQTQVYRSSQQLDLAGKVVEKTTGGVKQVLQTQL